jgi:hypothetical protein
MGRFPVVRFSFRRFQFVLPWFPVFAGWVGLASWVPRVASASFEVLLRDGKRGGVMTLESLRREFKSQVRREQDPQAKRVVSWRGVLLADALKPPLEALSVAERAQIDLLILHGRGGVVGQLPRAFIQKYPILLAFEREGKGLGRVDSVLPWTSFGGKLRAEGAPLETFFVQDIERIEFASYKDRYGAFLLKRRTDPSAMRGERIFVQNCTACHATGRAPSLQALTREDRGGKLEAQGHPAGKGAPALSSQEVRSLKNYLDAFRRENPQAGQATQTALYAPAS